MIDWEKPLEIVYGSGKIYGVTIAKRKGTDSDAYIVKQNNSDFMFVFDLSGKYILCFNDEYIWYGGSSEYTIRNKETKEEYDCKINFDINNADLHKTTTELEKQKKLLEEIKELQKEINELKEKENPYRYPEYPQTIPWNPYPTYPTYWYTTCYSTTSDGGVKK